MQSGARVGLSVGVLVLVSTANWQGTQPHSTRFTSAHSIEFDLVNFISYNLGRGWAGTRKAVLALIAVSLLSQSRCRSRNCTTDYSRFTGSKWPGTERRFVWPSPLSAPLILSLSSLSVPPLPRYLRSQARLPLSVSGPPSWEHLARHRYHSSKFGAN